MSRDLFNHGPHEFTLIDYIARTSLASTFAPQPFEDVISPQLESAFQRRMVNIDVEKRAKERIVDGLRDLDAFLVDFIDERFDLLTTAEGGICTLSAEFQSKLRTGSLEEVMNGAEYRRVKSGSDEHFSLWKRGWDRLQELLEGADVLHKLYIHKVYWQKTTQSGEGFKNVSDTHVNYMNESLDRMYDYLSSTLYKPRLLEYGNDELNCADDHKWGPTPFHYTDDSQRLALTRLQRMLA